MPVLDPDVENQTKDLLWAMPVTIRPWGGLNDPAVVYSTLRVRHTHADAMAVIGDPAVRWICGLQKLAGSRPLAIHNAGFLQAICGGVSPRSPNEGASRSRRAHRRAPDPRAGSQQTRHWPAGPTRAGCNHWSRTCVWFQPQIANCRAVDAGSNPLRAQPLDGLERFLEDGRIEAR